ncbi:hypothetical protein OC846_005220 [Tilletia horrida]|uniref:Cation-transporting P-type ATPase N-terminal domain-containing protein n=1 Tax=Tilletia horrida TaxID=155126 RepID=A0AAN6JS01_9BASI|nr:hypothetical protein OC846_005220 [Tilletia horrida]
MDIPHFNQSESAHRSQQNIANHGGSNATAGSTFLASEDGGAAPDEPPCSGYSPHRKHDSTKIPQHNGNPNNVVNASDLVSIQIPGPPSTQSSSTVASSASSINGEAAIHPADLTRHAAGTGTARTPLNAHLLPADVVLAHLGTKARVGLTPDQVDKLQREYGPNQLTDPTRVSAMHILARQVFNALTMVLIGALVLSFAVKDWVEGAVVCAVIFINVGLAFAQEWQAERTMASLRQIASPTAVVMRGGEGGVTIPATELVPGDLVELSTGDIVPADLRLITVNGLEIEESALTGESVPVSKVNHALVTPAQALAPASPDADASFDVSLADRVNCAFASTMVTTGRAVGVVVAIGNDTQVGQIAAQMRNGSSSSSTNAEHNPDDHRFVARAKRVGNKILTALGRFFGLNVGTPLQRRMNKFAFVLLGLALVCAIIVFGVAEFHIDDQVIFAIALGIGVIPESLTAVLTITFSVGAKRMARRNVIVRRLETLEALGTCSMIASDKTGTLTEGKMVVRECWLPDSSEGKSMEFDMGGDASENKTVPAMTTGLRAMATVASLCNVAQLSQTKPTGPQSGEKKAPKARGNPTEIALAVFADALGMSKASLLGKSSSDKAAETAIDFEDDSRAASPIKEKSGVRVRSVEVPQLPPASYVEVGEFPFDGTIKRMTCVYQPTTHSVHQNGDIARAFFMKGAVERVLLACTHIVVNESAEKENVDFASLPTRELDQAAKDDILARMEAMASKGLRVLAMAQRFETGTKQSFDPAVKEGLPSKALQVATGADGITTEYTLPPREEVEQDFTFLGLVALRDPPRPETRPSVKACHRAGITVHMVTGDHPSTARQIALDVGILKGNEGPGAVMEARHFDQLSDAEVDKLDELPLVIARCSPNTKVRLVEAAARRGKLLAMTGDGTNDCPSLKKAPVGIAMGQNGTEAARDSSDIVLQDDNFSSIVQAVAVGRTIFDNIQRFLISLLVANVGEVILLLGGLGFRDAQSESVFPLSPLQILFTNAVVASLPAVGLGMEPAERGSMLRHPDQLAGGVFSRAVIVDMLVYGTAMGVTCLATFVTMIYGVGGGQLGEDCNEQASEICSAVFQARSATFVALILQNLFLAWELISMRRSFFVVHPWKRLCGNPLLLGSVLFGIVLVPICLYVPGFNDKVFRHGPLRGEGWGIAIAAVVLFVLAIEGWKWAARNGGWPWLTRISGGDKARIPLPDADEDECDFLVSSEKSQKHSVHAMA